MRHCSRRPFQARRGEADGPDRLPDVPSGDLIVKHNAWLEMALPDYEIQLTTRPLGGEVQRQVDVAIRSCSSLRPQTSEEDHGRPSSQSRGGCAYD